MTTTEIAKHATTKYFIEYICDDINNTYWQIVRTKDAAILFANSDLQNIYAHCYLEGISRDDVSMWQRYCPVVQRLTHRILVPGIHVRIMAGQQKCLCGEMVNAVDSKSTTH